MRPPLRSIRHTKIPRADHNTVSLTSRAPSGSIPRQSYLVVMRAGRCRGARPALRHVAVPGTNRARGTCHGGRPSFPPPPVLGRSTLGAVDMPIGCALTFVQRGHVAMARRGPPSNLDVLVCARCSLRAAESVV